jgi:hypothetical protein
VNINNRSDNKMKIIKEKDLVFVLVPESDIDKDYILSLARKNIKYDSINYELKDDKLIVIFEEKY